MTTIINSEYQRVVVMTWHAFFLISVIVGFAFNPLSYLGGLVLIAAILKTPRLADRRWAASSAQSMDQGDFRSMYTSARRRE